MNQNYTIRLYKPGDGEAINNGFNEIFGLQRSFEEWRWKFDDGNSWITVAFDEANQIVGHFSAVREWLKIEDQVSVVGQAVDIYRIRRPSTAEARVFVDLGRFFFDQYTNVYKVPLIFGFPGEHSMNVGMRHFNFGNGGKIHLWQKPVPSKAPLPPPRRWFDWRRTYVTPALPTDSEIDGLWKRSMARYSVALVRDSQRFQRRFAAHPVKKYHYLTVGNSGRPAALGVFLQAENVLKWIDLLWDGQSAKTLVRLDAEALRLAQSLGVETLEMWLMGDPLAEATLRAEGWTSGEDARQPYLSATSWTPDFSVTDFFTKFYLTMSDSDLV